MKIGLIVEGGGMKCAYSAGILDCFNEEQIEFDYGIGVSAGCANLASYQAHQIGRNKRFYTDHIKEKGYYGFSSLLKTGDLFGLDYIYSTLTNSDGTDPLDFKAMSENPAEYYLVVTNAKTGQAEYYAKNELSLDDYELIKGSCAIPGACRPRKWKGNYYFDGGVSDSIPIKRALEDGCDKVVVLLSKYRYFQKDPEGLRFFYKNRCRKYPKIIEALDQRHIVYNKQLEFMRKLEAEGKAFVFAIEEDIKMSTFSMDPILEQKLYDMGREDFCRRENELYSFINALE